MIAPHLRQFIADHRHEDVRQLALAMSRFPKADAELVLRWVKGWQVARTKIPTWHACEALCYPIALSMEQCSSEATARFKASLAGNGTLIDLTGGFGVDFYFMAQQFSRAIYVEQNPDLHRIATHNFSVLNLVQAETHCADAIEFLEQWQGTADTIFIDPARRDSAGRKVVLLEDCTPNITQIEPLLEAKAHQTIIKLSPMIDITASLKKLRYITQVCVVASGGEVKELLLVKNANQQIAEPTLRCIELDAHGTYHEFSFLRSEEEVANPTLASHIGTYLYEPAPTILKAGAYKTISVRLGIDKLHANTHLYTSEWLLPDFPGRSFRIVETFSFSKSDLKRLSALISSANIAVRNFPLSVAELRQKLKLKDGGKHYLFATTLANKHLLLLGQRV